MQLAQARIVCDQVEALAGFYARLVGVSVALNEYYVEVPAGSASVGFSQRRFTEYAGGASDRVQAGATQVILDFEVADVDAEYQRLRAIDLDWVLAPTTQPWGNRSMILRDPAGVLINVFSRPPTAAASDERKEGTDDGCAGS
jgi:predicted enzyme related to lactoylglutathione lyase